MEFRYNAAQQQWLRYHNHPSPDVPYVVPVQDVDAKLNTYLIAFTEGLIKEVSQRLKIEATDITVLSISVVFPRDVGPGAQHPMRGILQFMHGDRRKQCRFNTRNKTLQIM